MRDKESLRQCMRHSDIVYNLIGRDYETRNFTFQDVHVDAARNIAQVCTELNIPRLVHVSALNASMGSSSEFFKTKAEGERAVRAAYPAAIIVRPGSMYGWEDRMLTYLGCKDKPDYKLINLILNIGTVTHPVKRWFFLSFLPLLNGGSRKFNPVFVRATHVWHNTLLTPIFRLAMLRVHCFVLVKSSIQETFTSYTGISFTFNHKCV